MSVNDLVDVSKMLTAEECHFWTIKASGTSIGQLSGDLMMTNNVEVEKISDRTASAGLPIHAYAKGGDFYFQANLAEWDAAVRASIMPGETNSSGKITRSYKNHDLKWHPWDIIGMRNAGSDASAVTSESVTFTTMYGAAFAKKSEASFLRLKKGSVTVHISTDSGTDDGHGKITCGARTFLLDYNTTILYCNDGGSNPTGVTVDYTWITQKALNIYVPHAYAIEVNGWSGSDKATTFGIEVHACIDPANASFALWQAQLLAIGATWS